MKSGQIFLNIQTGTQVRYKGKSHHIKYVIDLNEVLLSDDETNNIVHAKIGEIEPFNIQPINRQELIQIPDKEWEEANYKRQIDRAS